tara:strand:+ start:60 stop:200 length:141 start_codon:yes stop_codon:yes gene_type:complete
LIFPICVEVHAYYAHHPGWHWHSLPLFPVIAAAFAFIAAILAKKAA